MSEGELRVFDQVNNKYELAIVAAREARRINSILRFSGEELTEKVTIRALKKALNSEVKYQYEESLKEQG